MNDRELLQHYATCRSEAAFTELVKRYVDLVHSAALRQVGGDTHLAQDVTQTVFIDLARKAGSLSERTVLAGWLYTSTRDAAPDQNLIGEIAPPVDDEYDTRFEFDLHGTTSRSVSRVGDAMETAAAAYANANNGLLPRDSSKLMPYLQQAVDPARIQKFLSQIPSGITTLEQMQQARR